MENINWADLTFGYLKTENPVTLAWSCTSNCERFNTAKKKININGLLLLN